MGQVILGKFSTGRSQNLTLIESKQVGRSCNPDGTIGTDVGR
jgi:hypothetical protein